MLSEFYQLRRTAIKDLAAYCGFLIGLIGSAPFAWPVLTAEIDRGNFVLGLWYFFGLVSLAAVSMGIVGLGTGFILGWVWERYHRYKRGRRSRTTPTPADGPTAGVAASTESRRLHLVGEKKH